MVKVCLWCKKDYEAKKESSKYCSTSCRVMFNRKPANSNQIKPFQMQAIYNQILEMNAKLIRQIENSNFPPLPKMQYVTPISEKQSLAIYNATHIDQFTSIETVKQKSFQEHMNEIAELDTPYEYEVKTKEIESSNLTRKQKDLLFLNMKSAKF